jgi:hypothetical protein
MSRPASRSTPPEEDAALLPVSTILDGQASTSPCKLSRLADFGLVLPARARLRDLVDAIVDTWA